MIFFNVEVNAQLWLILIKLLTTTKNQTEMHVTQTEWRTALSEKKNEEENLHA